MARLFSRRATQVLLILLALVCVGTVAFLSAVNAYFSIDKSAIILAEELGTWEEISFTGDRSSLALKTRYPQLADTLNSKPALTTNMTKKEKALIDEAIANAKHAAEAAKKAGFSNDDGVFIPPVRDNSVKVWNATTDPPEKIPRIIHQTWKDKTLPSNWQEVRDECAQMHPDYKYMLWTDAESRQFLVDHYSWFVPIFDAYPYNIQRADAIRYFVLHYYGGIYMDLDVGCQRRLDPLLRFEVILPKTIPVGVSNDVMASAKEHPFMDHLIHNLVTFNHRYLTHYPTVMFSTGPMFVSASYGLYVDAHGLAMPSTPANPSAGFTGIRVLPKSLYGKNAKPSDAPNAFFRHYYGSSWHANDAGFLIFLRDNGKILILIGSCIALYGLGRGMLPGIYAAVGERRERRSRGARRGRWIPLPFVRDPRSGRFQPIPTHIPGSVSSSKQRSKVLSDESTQTGMYSSSAVAAATSLNPQAVGEVSGIRVAAPRPQRMSMPLFQLRDGEVAPLTDEDEDMDLGPGLNAEGLEKSSSSILHRMWDNFSSGGSRPGSAEPAEYDGQGETSNLMMRRGSASKEKAKSSNIFYLPAFFVGGGGSSSGGSASSTTDSTMTMSRIMEEDGGLNSAASVTTPSSNPSLTFWNTTQPHARHVSNSSSNGFSNWAASFLPSGSTMSNTMRGASPTLQSMLGNLSGRTPSPTMHLAGISHALHSNRVVEDLESSTSIGHGRGASSSRPPLSSPDLISSREASSRYLSSARQSIDAERPPPPYDQSS